jgi:hypothetical protein
MDYKNIHIGTHIKHIAGLRNLSISRACSFLKCSHKDIKEMYTKKSLDSDLLLGWCKLLDYNFFMFYHSHLQLYKPSASIAKLKNVEISNDERENYVFRKNLYMPEIIDWLLSKLDQDELTVKEIIAIYNIPKTTIYRWKKKRG